jgi:hypothetical protein
VGTAPGLQTDDAVVVRLLSLIHQLLAMESAVAWFAFDTQYPLNDSSVCQIATHTIGTDRRLASANLQVHGGGGAPLNRFGNWILRFLF